jgi:hypothetical protein
MRKGSQLSIMLFIGEDSLLEFGLSPWRLDT